MYFIINAYDYKDPDSLERRMGARQEHMKNIELMKARGQVIMAAAMLDDEDNMCGSTMVLNMDSRLAIDAYLEGEAYVQGKVWETIEIIPCKIPGMFL